MNAYYVFFKAFQAEITIYQEMKYKLLVLMTIIFQIIYYHFNRYINCDQNKQMPSTISEDSQLIKTVSSKVELLSVKKLCRKRSF